VEACAALVFDTGRRRALAAAGLERIRARDAVEILRRATSAPRVPSRGPKPPVPTRINIGSGKDWRFDCLNLDCNADWGPDVVVDLNRPFPPPKPLPTRRFGTARIERGYFDEIVANDVLEHIQDLPTAMKSCLDLLKVGGRFRIQVPYDLSYGAWQDPTHVRAFNEMSWAYYTDWFWYLGWTEARFEIEAIAFVPSEVGHELRQQGVSDVELRRRPRAIDYMQVVLRKRLLTAEELAVAARFNPTYLPRTGTR
jgi:SAM-dependent methyltransferase